MLDRGIAVRVYVRDKWQCRHCGYRNALHPHHLLYKSHGGKDTVENLITLCAECHRGHHDGNLAIVFDFLKGGNGTVKFTRVGNWRPGH